MTSLGIRACRINDLFKSCFLFSADNCNLNRTQWQLNKKSVLELERTPELYHFVMTKDSRKNGGQFFRLRTARTIDHPVSRTQRNCRRQLFTNSWKSGYCDCRGAVWLGRDIIYWANVRTCVSLGCSGDSTFAQGGTCSCAEKHRHHHARVHVKGHSCQKCFQEKQNF